MSLKSVKHSAIMIPVAVTSEEDAYLRQYMQYAMFPSRVNLITFETSVSSFPVNTLRSIAVQNCPSTHVLITTVYTIPSSTSWFPFSCSRSLQLPLHHPRIPTQRSPPSSHRSHIPSWLLFRSVRYVVRLQRLVTPLLLGLMISALPTSDRSASDISSTASTGDPAETRTKLPNTFDRTAAIPCRNTFRTRGFRCSLRTTALR